MYDSCCISEAYIAAADTVIAYITHDDRPNYTISVNRVVVGNVGLQRQLVLLLHYTRLTARTTRVSRHQKGKTSLDSNKARDDGGLGCSGISWTMRKQSAPRSRQITTRTRLITQ